MTKKIFFLFLLPLLTFSSIHTAAKPLYELGLLGAGGTIADYPASDQTRLRSLVIPYFIYRGDILKSDQQQGTRLSLLSSDKIDVDFSFGGSFQTDTDKNDARRGMPKLDWTIELGPRLLYYFYKNPEFAQVRMGLPLRSAFATDFQRIRSVGYTVSPTFQIDLYDVFTSNLNFYFIANYDWLDEGLADYFYQIDPQYQTAERASYDARSGGLGYDLSLSSKYQTGNMMMLLAARYSNYADSSNRQSFLHKKDDNWTYFMAVGWVFYKSEEMSN